MLVTTIDEVDLAGHLTELVLSWSGEPSDTGAPLSFNQANHLAAHDDNECPSVWLAGTVDLPGERPDMHRVSIALRRLLAEHDALRARFVTGPDGALRQDAFGADQVGVIPRDRGHVTTSGLAALLDERCRPGRFPGIFVGVVDRTLVCAFDHAHADAHTVDLVIRRVRELYRAPVAEFRPGAGYLDRCRAEHALPRVSAGDDPALAGWVEFFDRTGGEVPPFPLPLGVTGRHRQSVTVCRLLDDAAAEQLGARPFPVLLALLAEAVRDAGGGPELSALIPVHTRGRSDSPWHGTAGWLVTNAPVTVAAGDVAGAVAALRRALNMSAVPLDEVLRRCCPAMPTEDVFMVSYIDYRRFGPALPNARHISASGTTDTVQMWFSRHHGGLDLRVRFPGAASARTVVAGLVDHLRAGLAAAAAPREAAYASI